MATRMADDDADDGDIRRHTTMSVNDTDEEDDGENANGGDDGGLRC